MKRKILAILGVVVCFSFVVSTSVIPCFASTSSGAEDTQFIWFDYAIDELGNEYVITPTEADTHSIGGSDISVPVGLDFTLYLNDFTWESQSYSSYDALIPTLVLTDYEWLDNPTVTFTTTLSWYEYDSSSESNIVKRKIITGTVPYTTDSTETFNIFDIGTAIETSVSNYGIGLTDEVWLSLSSTIVQFVTPYEADGNDVYWEVYSPIDTGYYHGALVPLDVSVGGGSSYDDLQEAYQNGYEDGYDVGHESGYHLGYEVGYDSGYDVGYDSGYDDGNTSIDNVGEFLVGSIGAFLDAEIFPGLTMGGILLIGITVPLVLLFLKLFAGG